MMKNIIFILSALFYCAINTAHATVNDFITVTWNLQGKGALSTADYASKYSLVVLPMLARMGAYMKGPKTVDAKGFVVALQESGAGYTVVTPLANPASDTTIGTASANWKNYALKQSSLLTGSNSRGTKVYQYHMSAESANTGTKRLSLSVLSDNLADEVFTIFPPSAVLNDSARPVLGIRIGNDYFFSIHASASKGAGNGEMVKSIYDFLVQQNGKPAYLSANSDAVGSISYRILGDYNSKADILIDRIKNNMGNSKMPTFMDVVTQNEWTQKSGGAIDYGIQGCLIRPNMAGCSISPPQQTLKSSIYSSIDTLVNVGQLADHRPVVLVTEVMLAAIQAKLALMILKNPTRN